jgi:hypothetical protein
MCDSGLVNGAPRAGYAFCEGHASPDAALAPLQAEAEPLYLGQRLGNLGRME